MRTTSYSRQDEGVCEEFAKQGEVTGGSQKRNVRTRVAEKDHLSNQARNSAWFSEAPTRAPAHAREREEVKLRPESAFLGLDHTVPLPGVR